MLGRIRSKRKDHWVSFHYRRSGKVEYKTRNWKLNNFVELKNISIFSFWGELEEIYFFLSLPLSTVLKTLDITYKINLRRF